MKWQDREFSDFFYVSRFSLILLYVLLSAAEKPEQIKNSEETKNLQACEAGWL